MLLNPSQQCKKSFHVQKNAQKLLLKKYGCPDEYTCSEKICANLRCIFQLCNTQASWQAYFGRWKSAKIMKMTQNISKYVFLQSEICLPGSLRVTKLKMHLRLAHIFSEHVCSSGHPYFFKSNFCAFFLDME